mgnify:CR=1 FL=1
MHPLYNPSALSDDDIQDKLAKCYQALNYQSQFGRQPTMDSIRQVIDSLEYEKERRIYERQKAEQAKQKQKAKDSQSDHIELGEVKIEEFKDDDL